MCGAREIILIDTGLSDRGGITEALRPGVAVREVPRDADGMAMLERALADGATAVHVVAHGEPGRIHLGRGSIDAAAVAAAGLPASGADVLLYGCRTGGGEAGRQLAETLAAQVGGGVRASSHPVGDPTQGAGFGNRSKTCLARAMPTF